MGIDEKQAVDMNELKRKLYIDAVLGCNNRAKYEEDTKSYSGVATLFSVDANNLKYINDNFSHEAGDFLLGVVAKAGMKIWSDNFYRSGGDEFLVYIPDEVQTDDVCKSQIKAFKAELVELNKEKPNLPVSAAVGYASTSSGVELKALLEEADKLMYADKKAYKEANPQYDMRKAGVSVDTVKKAVSEVVEAQNNRVKLDVTEVLQEEVSCKLDKYKKRRKRRNMRGKIFFCIKGVVILLLILFILGNQHLRTKIYLVYHDAEEIVSDLLQGKETSSNKLVEDLFEGFNINWEGKSNE